ncbi:sensor domain-containing diguanylate cyclase [Thalassotalea marina]|uniref:diguanylate cyclase n=1 Tax=Thalassotalea marina TaxID=1673741 RepID=A0A919BDN4_9GAMM|nr:GGDEF domain-containing protein [Thalassotalea marina]GHF83720.1 GGDEF domain-containing protein [Thalassotalea marina]
MKIVQKFDRYITTLYFFTIIAVVFTAYLTFKEVLDSYNKSRYQSLLPLFTTVKTEIIRPINVAHFMAADPLLIELVEKEQLDTNKVLRYLKSYADSYNMLTFIALEKHQTVIDSSGEQFSLSHEKASWYPRLKTKEEVKFTDMGKENDPRLYVDIKLFNRNSDFIGFIGVAINLDRFAQIYTDYYERFGFEVVFVNDANVVTLDSNALMKPKHADRHTDPVSVTSFDWYQEMLVNQDKYQLNNAVVSSDSTNRIISQMPIQSFNWRMFIISPPTSQQSEYWQIFLTRMGSLLLVILVLYFFFISIIDYFKNQLVEDSETDHLTQLPNRTYLTWRYEEMASKYHNLCVVIADIDHFKPINDDYGHNVGDDVLKAIASHLKQSLRNNDLIGRWGGEEFVMLLPNTKSTDAKEIIERIRQRIEKHQFTHREVKKPFGLTVSFGIYHSEFGLHSLNDIVAQADKALYRAKSLGRNRIEVLNEA